MRKINNIRDLEREQWQVAQRKIELEKELCRDLNDIRAMGDDFFFSLFKKTNAIRLVSQGISFGTGLLVKKFGEKIESKLFGWFK